MATTVKWAAEIVNRGSGIATLLLMLAFGLAGCAGSPIQFSTSSFGTLIEEDHSLVQKGAGNYATVYFIRPDTERYMGVADNRLVVELDRELLLSLVKSDYTVMRIKPGEFDITLKSQTIAGPFREFKKMKKSKRFEFESGSTYYISIEPVDGEFRGVYFLPHLVDRDAALEMTRFMRPVGLAKEEPLHAKGSNPVIPFLPFL